MELLKVLAMPFQLTSLLFVAASSLLMALLISMVPPHPMTMILMLFVIWLMLVWLTNYALRLIDDAANGVRESSAASAEMLSDAYLDSRAWIHPLIAVAAAALHLLRPQLPVAPTLAAGALLLPASLGACAMTGYARDALNPLSLWRVIRGVGLWYLPLVLFVSSCVLLAVFLERHLPFGFVLLASLQLLLLVVYAAIGGAIYERRLELGFDPRHSPERIEEKLDAERAARRQQFLDELHKDLRARKSDRAIDSARSWLAAADAKALPIEVQALVEAGKTWAEQRDYPLLLQGLLPPLLQRKQAGLACRVAEAGLASAAEFRARSEAETASLVRYALETGRRRTASRLLENYLARAGDGFKPGTDLAALQERLQPPG